MANRDLAAAWNQWQENAQLQQATRRAVRRWVQACLAGAFLGWVDAVVHGQAMKEKLEGALAKLANRDLAAAWNQWQENAQLQQATRRAVTRWVQACLAGAFLGWVDAVSSAATMRDKLGRALAKLA